MECVVAHSVVFVHLNKYGLLALGGDLLHGFLCECRLHCAHMQLLIFV